MSDRLVPKGCYDESVRSDREKMPSICNFATIFNLESTFR